MMCINVHLILIPILQMGHATYASPDCGPILWVQTCFLITPPPPPPTSRITFLQSNPGLAAWGGGLRPSNDADIVGLLEAGGQQSSGVAVLIFFKLTVSKS